jgi:hypothetical protein
MADRQDGFSQLFLDINVGFDWKILIGDEENQNKEKVRKFNV